MDRYSIQRNADFPYKASMGKQTKIHTKYLNKNLKFLRKANLVLLKNCLHLYFVGGLKIPWIRYCTSLKTRFLETLHLWQISFFKTSFSKVFVSVTKINLKLHLAAFKLGLTKNWVYWRSYGHCMMGFHSRWEGGMGGGGWGGGGAGLTFH